MIKDMNQLSFYSLINSLSKNPTGSGCVEGLSFTIKAYKAACSTVEKRDSYQLARRFALGLVFRLDKFHLNALT